MEVGNFIRFRLVEFEVKKSFFIERKKLLESQLTTLWGKQKGDLSTHLNFDPLLGIVESHGTILAIEAALADAIRRTVVNGVFVNSAILVSLYPCPLNF